MHISRLLSQYICVALFIDINTFADNYDIYMLQINYRAIETKYFVGKMCNFPQ